MLSRPLRGQGCAEERKLAARRAVEVAMLGPRALAPPVGLIGKAAHALLDFESLLVAVGKAVGRGTKGADLGG